jgi:hypothetical protein
MANNKFSDKLAYRRPLRHCKNRTLLLDAQA